MVDAATIATLRANIGDVGTPPAYTDAELAALLQAAGGVEPPARVAALLPLWAEAAGRTDYSTGTASEKAAGAFDQLKGLLAQAKSEVAALDARAKAASQAAAPVPVAVEVQFVF